MHSSFSVQDGGRTHTRRAPPSGEFLVSKYLFSDLDGTLVYSHRAPPPGELVVAEHLLGRAQSWMTRRTFDFFASRRDLRLVPVTMRTPAQYARLAGTLGELGCRQALVCNGGLLLEVGEADPGWLAETRALAEAELPGLAEAELWLRRTLPGADIHPVEGIMVYARAEDPAGTSAALGAALRGAGVRVYHDSRKVYCLPQSVHKGAALRRFAARAGASWCAAAGDSAPDLPMLEAADLAILPEALDRRVENREKRVFDGRGCFSDFICRELENRLSLDSQPGISGRL